MIVLLGNCGAARLASLVRDLTGTDVRVLGWTQVDEVARLNPDLVYADLFGFDVIAPACVAAATGSRIPRPDIQPLRSVVAGLAGTPVVYRGVRRPSSGAFGLLDRCPDLDAWFDELASVIATQRVLDVQGLWARAGIPLDDVAGGMGHGEPLGSGVREGEIAAAIVHEARWIESLWASRSLPPIECVVVDLDLLIRGDLLDDDFHRRNPAWLPDGQGDSAAVLEAWWYMDRGLHEALRIAARRGPTLALTSGHPFELVAARFQRRRPEADRTPGRFGWMYETLPEEMRSSAFSVHPQLVNALALDISDFAAVEAGPESRSEMCRRIADRLAVPLDALLFLGATEEHCSDVRTNAPAVTLPPYPVHQFRDYLLHGPRLTRWSAPPVRQPSRPARPDGENLTAALHALHIVIDVHLATPRDLVRVEELLILCTEINLTGERPDLNTVDAIYVGTCRDNMRDHGIVSAALVRDCRLVNWVCSCHMYRHRVATALLALMIRRNPVVGPEFADTGRNGLAAAVIRDLGSDWPAWVGVDPCAPQASPALAR